MPGGGVIQKIAQRRRDVLFRVNACWQCAAGDLRRCRAEKEAGKYLIPVLENT
jgi:hypothetical protein